ARVRSTERFLASVGHRLPAGPSRRRSFSLLGVVVMADVVVRVAPKLLGHNTMLAHGFMMGTLPGGGYGIRWRCGVGGERETNYEPPWAPGRTGIDAILVRLGAAA